MATINSTQTGNWATGATWVGGVAPGTADKGVVKATHDVTVAAALAAIHQIEVDGGHLILNEDVTFDDAASAGLTIKSTTGGEVSSNGTRASPRLMESASSSPTHPWTIRVEDQTTVPDDRSLDFDFVEFQGHLYFLGNDDYPIDFNGGGSDDPQISHATPLVRGQRLTNHFIDGRTTSRIYDDGGWAGISQVSGNCSWDSWLYAEIAALRASKKRLSFFSDHVHIPLCKIEDASFLPIPGNPFIPFTLTLLEDK